MERGNRVKNKVGKDSGDRQIAYFVFSLKMEQRATSLKLVF